MDAQNQQQIEACVAALNRGDLTEACLRQAFAAAASPPRQDLLYLQSSTVGIDCQVIGMRLLLDGVLDDGPEDPQDWPYQSVLAAIQDGWRIISFPNLALLMDESKTYGLGHEFILEKWR